MLLFDEDFNLYETSKAESKLLLGKCQVFRISNLNIDSTKASFYHMDFTTWKRTHSMKHAQISEKCAGFQDSIRITKVDASGGTLLRGLAECVNN